MRLRLVGGGSGGLGLFSMFFVEEVKGASELAVVEENRGDAAGELKKER